MNKKIFIFFVFFGFVFAQIKLVSEQSGIINISMQDTVYTAQTDYKINQQANVDIDGLVYLEDKDNKEIYMCPGSIKVDASAQGNFYSNSFAARSFYFRRFCSCGNTDVICNSACYWNLEQEGPYKISFISDTLSSNIASSYEIIGNDHNNNPHASWNTLYNWITTNPKKASNVVIRTEKAKDAGFEYQSSKSYVDLLIDGKQVLDVKNNNKIDEYDFSKKISNNGEISHEQESDKLEVKLPEVSDYKINVGFKINRANVLTFSEPINEPNQVEKINNKEYKRNRTIFNIGYNYRLDQVDIKTEDLIVHVVNPDRCDEIDIIEINPNPILKIKTNEKFDVKFKVSHKYELFNLTAKDIRISSIKDKNGNNLQLSQIKITKKTGLDQEIVANNPHELIAEITPQTTIIDDSKICFEIDFQTTKPFCDGNICKTTKEVCVDYNPEFYCQLKANTTQLIASETAQISATCYLNGLEEVCPDLTWEAYNFNKPPNQIQRVVMEQTINSIGVKPSPKPFISKITTKSLMPRTNLPIKQIINLYTYSDEEIEQYNQNNPGNKVIGGGTPATQTGLIKASGQISQKKFECTINIKVNKGELPDLVPVIQLERNFNTQGKLVYKIKWGVKNQGREVIKDSGDSPLGRKVEIIGANITTPFEIGLYWPPGLNKAGITDTVNRLDVGQTYWYPKTIEYECEDPKLLVPLVEVDIGNKIKEVDENNNKQNTYLMCFLNLVCRDFL
jgi:hypothetical protein